MSILVDDDTRLVVQGFTGSEGSFHAEQMIEYGTNVVAGVTPGKGGQTHLDRPVYNTVAEAVDKENANTSIIFVPPPFAADAIQEAADAGIEVIMCITEGIPQADMKPTYHYVRKQGAHLIGPNCPGAITPGEAKVGIMPAMIFEPGPIGLISRSGTLTYEAVDQLTRAGYGQSTAVGIGGDPVIGTRFIDALEMFEDDPDTEGVVLIGEIGGSDEQEAAKYIRDHMETPVFGFIAGRTAPPGRRMGHAGAIVSGGSGTAEAKFEALESAGATVVKNPALIGDTVKEVMGYGERGDGIAPRGHCPPAVIPLSIRRRTRSVCWRGSAGDPWGKSRSSSYLVALCSLASPPAFPVSPTPDPDVRRGLFCYKCSTVGATAHRQAPGGGGGGALQRRQKLASECALAPQKPGVHQQNAGQDPAAQLLSD